jgi:hypothetical protein
LDKKKDGQFEEVTFVDEDDNIQTQTYNVSDFKSSSLITFVRFQLGETSSIGSFTFSYYIKDKIYVIDNTNGKLYDISGKFYDLNIKEWSEEFNSNSCAYLKGAQLEEEEITSYIYRFSFSENSLKIEQCINLSKMPTKIFMVDKFDNIILGIKHHGTSRYLYSKGEIEKFQHYVYKGIDKIFYICPKDISSLLHRNDQTIQYDIKFINKNGTIEDCNPAPLTPAYLIDDYLIKKVDNVSYYLPQEKYGYLYYEYDGIVKITKNGDIYTAESIPLPEGSLGVDVTRILGNDRLYFLKESEVYYVEIETGEKFTLINNEYIINKIYSDNQGNIIYEGINKYQDDVIGMILPDDTITETVTKTNFEVFYLQPIN